MTPPSFADVAFLATRLAEVETAGLSGAQLVEVIAEAERAKAALAALQARATAALDAGQRGTASTRREHAVVSRSVAGMVGLARRESPHAGHKYLGLAKALVHEMPCTLAALTAGHISEFKAIIMVRETAVLSREDRAEVDRRLADKLAGYGVGRLAKAARAVGYEIDRESPLKRIRGAESDRRVGLRPAPDSMTWLGAFLPVKTGVGVFASLKAAAAVARAAGDPRTEAQVMADTLAGRILGAESGRSLRPDRTTWDSATTSADLTDQTDPAGAVGVDVSVVMGEATLFGSSDAPGWVVGYGPVPAALARRLVREAQRAWVRRLYAHPTTGELVTMDARRREFSAGLRTLGVLRDDICRTPWCDAPVKHADHILPTARGGASTSSNEQGLCEACNYRKEAPGWTTRGDASEVVTTTPTGHSYTSRPPPLPGTEDVKVIHIVGPPGILEYAPTG